MSLPCATPDPRWDRILELHQDTTGDRTCDECGYTNPCRTEQIARGH